MKPYLSIIVPAYNEAERIATTLIDIDYRMQSVDYLYEILVVNDGSTDATADVVRKMMPTIKHLDILDRKENRGKGYSVAEGMRRATGDIRIFTDADNSTSIEQFESFRSWFAQGFDVVIGSRAVRGSVQEPAQPWYRSILGRLSNIIIQIVNVPGIWDTQCGFKACTARAADAIFSKSRVSGWGFDIEMLALARRLGYRIKEVPIRWVNDTRSHVRASAYLKVFIENLMIRFWLITNRYHISDKSTPTHES